MTAGPRFFAVSAVILSVGAHLAGFGITGGAPEIQMQGGAPQQVAMLGNSLADMIETVTEPVEVEVTPPPPPTNSVQPPVAPQAAVVAPVPQAPLARPDQVATVPVAPSQPPVEVQTAPAARIAPAVTKPVEPITPTTVAQPKPPEAPKPPVTETIQAQEPVEVLQADANTPRPKSRPKPKPPKPKKQAKKPVKKAGPKPKTARIAQTSNTATAKKGQADGQASAKASQSSKTQGKARAAGNAARSNYPGKVMRKIQRTRKERGGGRGTAKVGFRVTTSGSVTSLRIIKSSGSPRIDQNALRHIQRAAPFPPPPSGAQTSFSVDFVSRG